MRNCLLFVIALLACVPAGSAPAPPRIGGPGGPSPRLSLAGIVGDVRGKGMQNLSVAVTEEGAAYLLMSSGRVALFDPEGKYLRSRKLSLPWPQTYCYLAARGPRVFLGDYRKDYPWVFSPRRVGDRPGAFVQPAMAAADEQGRLFVADTGNARVQVFAPGKTAAPEQVLPVPGKPKGLAVRGGRLAVLTADEMLIIFEPAAAGWSQRAAAKVGPGTAAVALGPKDALFVAFNTGPDRHDLKRYTLAGETIAESAVVAPSYMRDWPRFFPAGVPLTTGPDGRVWFGTDSHGKLLTLDPATDEVTEAGSGIPRALAVSFAPDGRVFAGGFPESGAPGARLRVYPKAGAIQGAGEAFPARGSLYGNRDVPIWGFLPDADGGVFMRVVEEGYRKGWPALTLKKVYADRTVKPFLDFGDLYAVRTRYHPSAMYYALEYDPQGNVLLAATPLQGVVKATREGKVLWEAGVKPQGGADTVAFGAPRDLAVDRRGNVWVVDGEKDRLFCLSPAGKLLLEYGTTAGVDDTEGRGFDAPSGVAVAAAGDQEFVYVGDSGNQRLLKFRVEYP